MPDFPGVYRHPPGRLSRWGVLDVGLKCVHSCKHCFYSFLDGSQDQFAGMRRAGWHSTENLFGLVDSLAANGFLGFDITGGEPTAHPGLVEIVARAASPPAPIASRIITLGQFLTRRDLLARLLDAGLVDFRFSLHATDPAMFHRMTGGDLGLLVAAMDECERRGFQHVTNTTITEQNWQALPEIARWIARRPGVYQTTFLFFMPYYEWAGAHAGEHRVRYSDIAARLREAVAIVEDAGIGATIRYAPQCTIRGLERNHVGIVGVRHDNHEWMNCIDHKADPATTTLEDMRAMGRRLPVREIDPAVPFDPGVPTGQEIFGVRLLGRRGGKIFPPECRGCAAVHVCDGVDENYVHLFGAGEIKPYREYRGNPIDRARLAYLPAFVSKVEPYADARGAVREAFAQLTTTQPRTLPPTREPRALVPV
jgi:molybdenum cofactor biosynthesis enzyme MoaA